MKWIDSIANNLIFPLVISVLTPVFTLVGSKLSSGDWLTWLNKIPLWGYVCFFGILLTWILFVCVFKRVRNLREKNLPHIPFVPPNRQYIDIGRLNHKKVSWILKIPAFWSATPLTEENINPDKIEVGTPPRCPKCDTEIEETETFWRKKKWACLRCGFKTKNDMSYCHEAVRAKKIAQSEWRSEYKKK